MASVERVVPRFMIPQYRRVRSYIRNAGLGRGNAAVFTSVYRSGQWGSLGDGGFYSGSGSYEPSVPAYAQMVRELIVSRNVRSIVEIGCGDFNVGRLHADAVSHYLGVDVAADLIAANEKKYGAPNVSFLWADAAAQDLPPADLCLIRQVFQHLSNGDIQRILDRVRVHRAVLVTEHLPAPDRMRRPNLDKRAGPDTRITFGSGVVLDQPPFNIDCRVVLETDVRHVQVAPGEILRSVFWTND